MTLKCILKKYRDIFGEPRKGVHTKRIGGFALVDTIGTIIITLLLAKYYGWNPIKAVIIAFILGEFLHYLFCVKTEFMTRYNIL